jgi:hypothetical protein
MRCAIALQSLSSRARFFVSIWIVVLGLAAPRICRAEDAPSIVGYGFEAMGSGAAIGLGVGYLSTGPEFQSGEWKKLVYGTAIGALAGLGVGIVLGVVDAGTSKGRGVGFYMVRDSNYGWSVGFVVGGIVGLLKWIGDGTGKDLLRGMAWGTVIGGGAGFLVGILEAALRGGGAKEERLAPPPETGSLRMRLGLAFTPTERGGVGTPYPTLTGRF